MAGMTEDSNDLAGQPTVATGHQGEISQVGYQKPPHATRFKPGRSGNPAGRKRKAKRQTGSAFTIILDKTIRVKSRSKVETCSIEEALQLKTYQEALKGKSMAIREVLRWILKRETWIAKNRPATKRSFSFEGTRQDPDNADEAMLLLAIATNDPTKDDCAQSRAQLLLEPWVVKAAMARSRRARSLTTKELDDIRRCSRDDGSIVWPLGETR